MIYGTNFEGALNLDIDFQKLFSKSLHNTNLRGHNLSEKNLDYLNLRGTNLENTNANIDPQKTIGKNLTNTILRGLNLSHKNFSGVNLDNTDFRGANIYGANFKGAIHLELANFDEEQKKYLFERHGITLDENAKDIEKIISAMEKNSKVPKNDNKIEKYRKISDELIDKYNEILLMNNNKIRR